MESISMKNPFCTIIGLSLSLRNKKNSIMCPVKKRINPIFEMAMLRDKRVPAVRNIAVAIHFSACIIIHQTFSVLLKSAPGSRKC